MDAGEDWDSWLAAKLEKDLAIADEAFAEYITQLCSEDSMEDDERREVIVEFLDEASAAGQPVAPCVDEILAKHAERQAAEAARVEEERAKSLDAAKQRELQALQADTTTADGDFAGAKKKMMSLEEKLARDRLLARYGYESDDPEEGAAGESKGGDGAGAGSAAGAAGGGGSDPSGLLVKNDNAERVRAEEQAKKAKAQAEHQKTVQRNKENVEKQKAEREKEKKRTVKKEKRRM
ncbi:hypothetical protein HDU86_002750 [Geranomyces michiganensis]|nr:hypothetical protein HDU86_002750 [Geranomyces michiganensis]